MIGWNTYILLHKFGKNFYFTYSSADGAQKYVRVQAFDEWDLSYSAVMPEPIGRGATDPSNFWKINLSYSNQGGQTLLTVYYLHPQFFSPSRITDSINRASE